MCLWNTVKPIELTFNAERGGAGAQVNDGKEANVSGAIPCIPIGAIFQVLQWAHINLMSLDTENTEQYILVAFPWTTVTVDVFLVERMANGMYPESNKKFAFLAVYLPLMGYRHVEYMGGQDDFFVRNDFKM